MFREKFRHYKRKIPPPDFSDDLNFWNNAKLFTQIKGYITENVGYKELGIINPSMWKIYESNLCEGLFLVRNPFTCIGQRYWISESLESYTRRPNIINLHTRHILGDNEDWWERYNKDGSKNDTLKKSLRWATLGYHHNWDTKVYSENAKTVFPPALRNLCDFIARVVLNMDSYLAEAAIVNFYNMDSTLSGHTDYSEPNREAPLISFSFGQSAIFLIGGLTLEEDPIAIFLHSGDVVVMSGNSRLRYHGVPRIVKVSAEPWNDFNSSGCSNTNDNDDIERYRDNTPLPNDSIKLDTKNDNERNFKSAVRNASSFMDKQRQLEDDRWWRPFDEYVKRSRINVNVRQVLYAGQKSLPPS